MSDPFATAAPAEPTEPTEDPFASTPADADIPTVNREGEPVTAPPENATEPPASAPEAETPTEAPATPEEAPSTPEDPGTGDVSPAVPAQPDATPQPESTPPEGATGPRGGKGDMRHYKLLYQTGPATWTEFDLTSVNQEETGVKIVKVDDEVWYEARNNEHANRLAFTIVGRPQEGVRIFPVPRGAYKPKTVKPAPPRPERERIVIS